MKRSEYNRTATTHLITGRCCCGAVSYIAKNVRPLWYCHCEQCRRMTGHCMAAAQVDLQNIDIKGETKWFYVNDVSRHGFCPTCGSQVFWRNDGNPFLSITGGSMDNSDKVAVAGHIFCAEKGDYYNIPADDIAHDLWDEGYFPPQFTLDS